ncbi:hypothetical protein V2J09_014142, partial [Rumex salicifolius]
YQESTALPINNPQTLASCCTQNTTQINSSEVALVIVVYCVVLVSDQNGLVSADDRRSCWLLWRLRGKLQRSAVNRLLLEFVYDTVNLVVRSAIQKEARMGVSLLRAHTIGEARCTNFRGHVYNDTNINAWFARARKSGCPSNSGNRDSNLPTPTCFDNSYYNNLVSNKGLLHSDQQPPPTPPPSSHFVATMIKMGDIKQLTGSNGEIGKDCRKPN